MTDLQITTVNDFDEEGIFPLRTVRVGDKTVRTPTVATEVGELQQREEVHPDSRGVNELYRTIGGDDLDEAMRDPDGGTINEKLQEDFEKTADDEVTVSFTKYTETSTFGPAHAQYMADLHATYSDIITVPMMPKLVRNVDPEVGLSDPNYRSFKKSVVAFLNQVEDRHPEKPVMGLIPRLGWEFIDDLMGVYEAHDVLAYAFDFNRCKVTTGTQVAMIQPLMESVARRGIEEYVLFYAINPSPGVVDRTLGVRPASDIASFGLGFDIVGGRHVSPNQPSEVFEEMEASDEEGPQFRLFDREEWVYREIPVSDLPQEFPEESAFDPERVAARVERSQSNAKYRFQRLVNGEQQALAAADLREELEEGEAYSYVSQKMGVTNQVERAYEQTRGDFDSERFQTGLGEF
jgi:hypothetical protein